MTEIEHDQNLMLVYAVEGYSQLHNLPEKDVAALFRKHEVNRLIRKNYNALHTRDLDVVDLSKSKDKRDFGRGFYTTTLREQAEDWAQALFDRYKGDGIIIYEMELEVTEELSVKSFEGLSEEWLLMVRENRTLGGVQHQFDVVQGPVANDKTARTIALYIAGIINANEAIERLRFNQVNNQVSLHTPAALSLLRIVRKYQK